MKWQDIFIYMLRSNGKRKTEVQAIFLNPFTVCPLCKRTFIVHPFVEEETNKSYPFANRLNGLSHLWHWHDGIQPCEKKWLNKYA